MFINKFRTGKEKKKKDSLNYIKLREKGVGLYLSGT